jgi:prepilin-type N-terminal cleavage/methylation domain-containing protein
MSLSKKNISLIQSGFSLIELLVVVSIIGILAGLGIFAYDSYVEYSRRAVNEANAKLLANALSAELAAQRGKLKSNCQQTLGRGPNGANQTWSNCVETLIRNNNMINPYSNRMYGSSPGDPQGMGTWTFTTMWDPVYNNSYAADGYFICGACSDDVGGLTMLYTVSESDYNPSIPPWGGYNKFTSYVATCSFNHPDWADWDPNYREPRAHKFFLIQE